MQSEDLLHQALLNLTGFLNRPQSDTVLLRRAGSTLDRALFPLLIRVNLSDGVTVGELADTVGRHHTTVSRQVTVLEQQGLVRREADPLDKRHAVVEVTEAGRAEAARIAAARREVMTEAFAGWTSDDKADLRRLVTKLVASLEAATAGERRKAGAT
jgi:DNA-binding MarR family transcriptional regulator